jgi:hypothetical protein
MCLRRRSSFPIHAAALALAGLAAWMSAPLAAQTPAQAPIAAGDETPLAIPAELQPAVTRAEFLGRQIYLHDRAAWLATDAMLADPRMRKLREKIRGWLTEPSAHGVRVIFIDDGDAPRRLFQIDVDESERLTEAVIEAPEPLGPDLLAQLRARKLALEQSFMRCARQYNSVILPSTDGLRVYLMPAFARRNVYPLGGYHLFETDAAGARILSSRKFTNGCIELDETAKDAPPRKDGFKAMGTMMFTHLLDPQPSEVHVFVSLYASQPFMLATSENEMLWEVGRGRIALNASLKD